MLSSSAPLVLMTSSRMATSRRFFSAQAGGKVWCSISGFSPFAHRSDLQIVLNDSQPIAIDPLLDRHLYPNGRYLLQFKSPEEVQSLKRHVMEKYSKKYFVSTEDMVKQVKASSYGISSKTVRISGIPENVGFTKLHLAYFLENYLVDKLPANEQSVGIPLEDTLNIRIVPGTPAGRIQYFVDLVSEEEAERLVIEKGSDMIDGTEISMFHYQT